MVPFLLKSADSCDQPPQLRTGPQSMWTKFEREYEPTPPAEQACAARAI
jgi:hypothetical protein